MEGTPADGWEDELEHRLEPFLARLRRKTQRHWAPFYLKGLILPGERKSVEPMAARVAPGDLQQLHHFISTSPWATAPLEEELVEAADRLLVGGPDAVLVVDDTALVKQGRHSVGVKRQYCGQLGKKANCQALVSLTLARSEVPVGVGLRLFLPEDGCGDAGRRAAAGVPEPVAYRPKWKIALDEIDRALASGARFGCVLADAEYGRAAEFRAGLGERRLSFAAGILPVQQVYPADVTLAFPGREATGRPRKHSVPSAPGVAAAELLESRPEAFRTLSFLAGRHQGAAPGRVRRGPGAGGRRAGGRTRPAPAGRGGVAGRRASGLGRAQVLSLQPAAGHHARAAGGAGQGAVGVRAGAPAAQGRAGARPLRGAVLARPAPPRPAVPAPAVPAGLRLLAAPAARGEKAPGPRPSPGRHPHRACPPSAGASSRL